MGIGIGDGRPRRWTAARQFPRRSSECRRHSGATTVTSQPRAADLVLDPAHVAGQPSDVSLAPWTKKRMPLGVAGAVVMV